MAQNYYSQAENITTSHGHLNFFKSQADNSNKHKQP